MQSFGIKRARIADIDSVIAFELDCAYNSLVKTCNDIKPKKNNHKLFILLDLL